MKLYLKNEIAKNKSKISNEAYLAYIIICLANKSNSSECLITVQQMLYDIDKLSSDGRQYSKWLFKGIDDLEELGYIKIKNKNIPKYHVVDTSKLIARDQLKDNSFTVIDSKRIKQILNSKHTHILHDTCLLRFYHCIMSTIFYSNKKEDMNKNGIGSLTLTRMSKIFEYGLTQISSYIKELEEINVIYFKRSSSMLITVQNNENDNEDQYMIIPGVYGDYDNKDKIIKYGIESENNYIEKICKDKKTKIVGFSSKSNSTRSVKQKRNRIAKLLSEGSNIPYGYEECKYIYNQMIENNKIKKGQFVKESDYDVFKGFDFYNEDEIKYVEIVDCPYETNIDNVDMDNINFTFD